MDFAGLRVVSFESRRSAEMAGLIGRHGGEAIAAPSMREVPLEDNGPALAFGAALLAGEVDMLVLLTGVGTRMLVKTLASRYPQEKIIAALGRIPLAARGPKPIAALRELGLTAEIIVPEPNTWQDLLKALDKHGSVQGKRVAVQEYGQPNPELLDGLAQRGAVVTSVQVYQWALPEDLVPLRQAVARIISGEVETALFTSATQATHLFKTAEQDGHAEQLREAFKRVVIGSIGPIATEGLLAHGLQPDYEPDSPHMANLVKEVARRSAYLLDRKRTAARLGVNTNQWRRIDMAWAAPREGSPPPRANPECVFLKACRREPTPYTPIWLMRQAGRYQREYRNIRSKVSMLELCKSAELAAEVTLMAVDRLGVDAGIIFADILLVVEAMGLHLDFVKGDGPVIANPVRGRADLDRLAAKPNVDELSYVFDALRITRKGLHPDVALIGFAGGPFTVASYMIEGGKSSHYALTKSLMYRDPVTWHGLMEKLVAVQGEYLNGQIAAGADAVQVFDSWAGALGQDDYRQFVMPHVRTLIDGLTKGTPVIHFATGNPALLPLMKQAGGDVIGLDWRINLDEAWGILGDDVAVMGNIDPIVLYATPSRIREAAKAVLDKASGRPGHIFNLGHGILPDMPPENAAALVDAVHELSQR